MNDPIHEIVFERLAADDVPSATADLIQAAVSGDADIESALAGRPTALDLPVPVSGEARDHVYLSSVTVNGFRGVGPGRTLHIPPRPGLTLVVGRNGSGKSSFAEAAELCLTGDSARWAAKNSVWRTGWRNLHAPDPCRIVTELRVDGDATPIRVERAWAPGAALDEAEAVSIPAGLAPALELYRPFLTAAELGKLLAGTPSELFDALGAILGMDALTDADKRLQTAIREIETRTKEVRRQRTELLTKLDDLGDERARAVLAVLKPATPDLGAVEEAVSRRSAPGVSSDVAACEAVTALHLTDEAEVAAIVVELRAAAAAAARPATTGSPGATNLADLLRIALDRHAAEGDGACPVCGTGSLDDRWRARAEARLAEFDASIEVARRAADRLAAAGRRARDIVAGRPVPPADTPIEVSLDVLRDAVVALAAAPTDPTDLAAHLDRTYPAMRAGVLDARERAAAWLAAHDTGWQQVTAEVVVWLAAARRDAESQPALRALRAARAWLKSCEAEIRDQRMAPFAAASQEIWSHLRQESNVNLGALKLAGTTTRRRVDITVSVDGSDSGAALGVMSQGELQSLGLALFLPRSCAQESPFRFVIIDDPVQSMDPAKVDGLAEVLAEIAKQRQVVVFTHDNRLPSAVRRLEIDARILEIVRAEQSVVTIRASADPVTRYLDDAYAVAKSTDIDEKVRLPVVAAMCRSAVEAACQNAIWRIRLGLGARHAEIEEAIESASRRTLTLVSFALFDDPDRGGEVMGHLHKKGPHLADALRTARQNVHPGGSAGDLTRLVNNVRALTGVLR